MADLSRAPTEALWTWVRCAEKKVPAKQRNSMGLKAAEKAEMADAAEAVGELWRRGVMVVRAEGEGADG